MFFPGSRTGEEAVKADFSGLNSFSSCLAVFSLSLGSGLSEIDLESSFFAARYFGLLRTAKGLAECARSARSRL